MEPNNIENHMAVSRANDPTDPRNARELGQFECDCGQDYGNEVKTLTYRIWRDNGRKFVEDCAGAKNDCGKRCCHACALTCQICGCHYCPDHRGGFFRPLSLCEECGAYYTTFYQGQEAVEMDKLIVIEKRLATGRAYGRGELLAREVDWLIQQLKEAWESKSVLAERIAKLAPEPNPQMLVELGSSSDIENLRAAFRRETEGR